MNFNKHLELEGKHAFLSASKYHWVNYTDEKLEMAYTRHRAAQMGTRLHELASELIILGIKLPRTSKTLNLYVNDAIGHKMKTEVLLYVSDNCFGTADSIKFHKNVLRIHDLKNGVTKSSMMQNKIYAAMFCTEYKINPNDIEAILRIYQNDEYVEEIAEPEEILYIMQKMKDFDNQIKEMKMEV